MFIRKLQFSAMLGAFFSVVVVAMTLSEGKGAREAFGMVPGAMLLAVIVTFWLTRNMDERGNEVQPSSEQQINGLQNKLRRTLATAADAAARGDHATATHMRSHAAVIESQLRQLGA